MTIDQAPARPSPTPTPPYGGYERRRAPRVRAVMPVTVRLVRPGQSQVAAGRTLDVSAAGLSLLTREPLRVGAQFMVYLAAAPPDGEALSLVYRVTRCEPLGDDGEAFTVAAALLGRVASASQRAPNLTARDILRRIRIDPPARR